MSTRSKGSVLWKVLINLALIIIVIAVAAEFGVRWMISDSMKKDLAQESNVSVDDASIKFGPTPVLLSAITGNVPSVDINTPSTLQITKGNPTTVKGNPPAQIEIKNLNIKDQNNPIAQHLVVHSQLPEDYLLAQIQESMAQSNPGGNDIGSQLMANLIRVTDLNLNSATGNVEVVFTDGAAKLNLHPTAENGKVHFVAEDAQLLGFKLPREATNSITSALDKQASDVGGNLSIDKFEVADGHLEVSFSGDNVPLHEAGGSAGTVANGDANVRRT